MKMVEDKLFGEKMFFSPADEGLSHIRHDKFTPGFPPPPGKHFERRNLFRVRLFLWNPEISRIWDARRFDILSLHLPDVQTEW